MVPRFLARPVVPSRLAVRAGAHVPPSLRFRLQLSLEPLDVGLLASRRVILILPKLALQLADSATSSLQFLVVALGVGF
jgi:hypothetical protein